MRERTRLAGAIDGLCTLEREVADTVELIALAEADGDAAMVAEAAANLRALADAAKRREIESLLSGEADNNDAYIEINAGAGGTEAQDWAEMLMRMYMRWAEQHGYKVQLLETSEGEQAGIKSATLQISGPAAYGWLKTEAGVHRLVRISPFDANARRQTSFASVWVYPVVDDTIDIEINEADLKVRLLEVPAGQAGCSKLLIALRFFTRLPKQQRESRSGPTRGTGFSSLGSTSRSQSRVITSAT